MHFIYEMFYEPFLAPLKFTLANPINFLTSRNHLPYAELFHQQYFHKSITIICPNLGA